MSGETKLESIWAHVEQLKTRVIQREQNTLGSQEFVLKFDSPAAPSGKNTHFYETPWMNLLSNMICYGYSFVRLWLRQSKVT